MQMLRPPRFSFNLKTLKSIAKLEDNPRHCPHRECVRRNHCTGGPRGTFRRIGKPLCRHAEVARAIAERRAAALNVKQAAPR